MYSGPPLLWTPVLNFVCVGGIKFRVSHFWLVEVFPFMNNFSWLFNCESRVYQMRSRLVTLYQYIFTTVVVGIVLYNNNNNNNNDDFTVITGGK